MKMSLLLNNGLLFLSLKLLINILIMMTTVTVTLVQGQQYCNKTKEFSTIVTLPETFSYRETYKTKFGSLRHSQKVGTRNVTKRIFESRLVEDCCDGYQKKNGLCIPTCRRACLNGKCTGPDVCTCNEGYEYLTQFKCKPKCNNCNHGTCIAPGFCDCYPDFKKADNGSCIPVCHNECINGFCSAPEICSCNEGYFLNETIKYSIYEEKSLISNKNDQVIICQPHCNENCENGYCSAPNTCSCNDGYKKHNISSNICTPKCVNDCENGLCIAPDHCICNPGYKMNEDLKECTPICSNGCYNGRCTEPEICTCNDGFKMQLKSVSICEPVCKPECEFGEFCNAPNECRCAVDYKKNSFTNKCQPYCSPECINSDCINPYECQCWNGYEKDLNIPNKCIPVCKLINCNDDNYECIAPNVCLRKTIEISTTELISTSTTDSDYFDDNKEIYENFPLKLPERLDEETILESETLSSMRALRSWNDNTCNDNCTNGICLNENCYCDNGYSGINCPEFCENKCTNGYCYNSDNSCTCFSNDEFNLIDYNCDTFCDVMCSNQSICILPIECNCTKGYEKNEIGLCVPACYHEKLLENDQIEKRSNCINGTCIAPNLCECDDSKNQILDELNNFICISNNSVAEKNISKAEQIPTYLYNLWFACLILLVLAGIIILSIIIYKKQKGYNVDKKEKEFGAYRYADGAVTYDDPKL